jgi:hypothetical protein
MRRWEQMLVMQPELIEIISWNGNSSLIICRFDMC